MKRPAILEISTVPSHDIAYLIEKALRNNFPNDKGEVDVPAIRKEFYDVKNYSGLSGNITIDSDGITRSLKNMMYRFSKGELVSP